VRRYFLENALQWLADFHIDALRLDATHAIRDFSAVPFLEELKLATQEAAERRNRRFFLIAESDLNDARIIHPREVGGYGLDGQWSDDLHHALHALLTGERSGYYEDFGSLALLARAYRDGYAYSGQRSAYRQRRHGNSPRLVRAEQLVVCAQNHDQVGNRMLGDRLSALISFDELKLAAGLYVPLLFMGEEYGETAPFLYYTSHGDPDLVAAVQRGRAEEFAAFRARGEPPDPNDPDTFRRSKLCHDLRDEGKHRALWQYYRELIRLRTSDPALSHLSKDDLEVQPHEAERTLIVRRWAGRDQALIAINFGWGGPGARVPEALQVPGQSSLAVPARTLLLYTRTQEATP
jgi:maltooligosyltrehalose trehalohydrolase